MGLGLQGAYGAAGAQDALQQLLKQRMVEQQIARELQQQEFQNQRQLAGDVRADRSLNEQSAIRRMAEEERTANNRRLFEDRERDNARAVAEQLAPGDVVDPAQGNMLRGSGLGSLVEHQGATLPSRQTSGFLTTTGGAPGPGVLRTTTQAENPARDVFRGTANQRLQRQTFDATAAERATDNTRQAERDIEIARHNAAMENKPPGGSAAAGLSPAMESNVLNRLSKQWNDASKPARELDRQVALMGTGIEAARRGDLAQGSQAVLVTFQKILDPTSVVRESEYMRSAAGQSLLNRVKGAYQRLDQGGAGVPFPELEKFAQLATEAAKAQRGAYLNATKERIGRSADRYKIPRDIVFEDMPIDGDDGGGGAVPMVAPDGRRLNVPAEKVSEMEALGAKRQ